MKLMQLTPGTGHFYCGSCLRDNTLGRALQRRGNEVTVVPLYLPQMLEEPSTSEQIHMGGINMFLQQKTRLSRYLPRWVANILDRPGLLRWASRVGSLTNASVLGAMTLSMLKGEHGHQAKELDKLVAWAVELERPDVIVLSNVLLSGVARRLREALDRPVVVSYGNPCPPVHPPTPCWLVKTTVS